MKHDDVIIIEEFVINSRKELEKLKDSLNILQLDEKQLKLFQTTLNIMESKINGVVDAKSKKEMKQFLKLNTLLKDKR